MGMRLRVLPISHGFAVGIDGDRVLGHVLLELGTPSLLGGHLDTHENVYTKVLTSRTKGCILKYTSKQHQRKAKTMSETVVTIHYQDGTQWELDDAGNVKTTGGEVEISGDQLIGLSRAWPVASHAEICGPPESFAPADWVQAEDILSEGAAAKLWTGWFPAFRTENREWIYTWSVPVDRVEVTVRP